MRVCICLGWVGLLRWNSIIGHSVGAGAGLGIVIQLGSSERRLLGCDLAMLTQIFIGIEWALSVVHSARSMIEQMIEQEDHKEDTQAGTITAPIFLCNTGRVNPSRSMVSRLPKASITAGATTNYVGRLVPALSRPGRVNVWVNFTNATKWQAEGIFKCFFPSRPSMFSPSSLSLLLDDDASTFSDASQKNPPGSRRKASAQAAPVLEEARIAVLAKRFDTIPEGEMSV